jgi:hypothetical protein
MLAPTTTVAATMLLLLQVVTLLACYSDAAAFFTAPRSKWAVTSTMPSSTWGSRHIASLRGGDDNSESAGEDSSSSTTSASTSHTASRGGSSSTSSNNSYATDLEAIKSSVLRTVQPQLLELKRQIVEAGETVDNFGATADRLCNQALTEFAASAPAATSPTTSAVYDAKLTELEAAVDAPLHVLYLKLLGTLREAAVQRYRYSSVGGAAGAGAGAGNSYTAMVQADAEFVRLATAATRDGTDDWDFSQERSFLQSILSLAADAGQKATDVQLNAMAFLQSQQQMIQQLQQQLYGQTSPWNVGIAYRIPDTNFNVNGSYQQGRANVQLSCVPDEYAPMLGPNGFTNGVGPGNLGLSLNLSM